MLGCSTLLLEKGQAGMERQKKMKYKMVGWSLESKFKPEVNILTLLREKERKKELMLICILLEYFHRGTDCEFPHFCPKTTQP